MLIRYKNKNHTRFRKLFIFSSILLLQLCPSIAQSYSSSSQTNDNPFNNDLNVGESISEELISLNELQNLDLLKLLEINFINKTVSHYRSKLELVQSSLDNRVKNLFEDLKGSHRSRFTPELQASLNNSLFELLRELQLSPYCLNAINHLRLEIQAKRPWPLKFIDSMEFIPTGLVEGVLSSFGLYEECLAIESPEAKWNGVRGKYCIAKVKLPFMEPTFAGPQDIEMETNPHISVDINKLSDYAKKRALLTSLGVDFDQINNKLKLLQMINHLNGSYYRIGACFPAPCTSEELERAINKFLDPLQNPFRIEIESQCSVANDEIYLNNYQRMAIIIIVLLSLTVGAATSYEYFMLRYRSDEDSLQPPRKKSKLQHILKLSALSNTRALFVNAENDTSRLHVIDIMVLMFALLEFMGRSYVLPVFYGMMNIKRPLEGLPKEYFTAKKFFFIRGSSFAASTYVLCSIIIVAYNVSSPGKNGPIKNFCISTYLKFALNRWASIARRLIGPIILIFLMPIFGDGPMWHYFDDIYAKPCRTNWLSSFLFTSNYANSLDEVCNSPSIIFSTVFHLSLLVPFVLILLNYRPFGYAALGGLIVVGCIVQLIPKLVFGIPVTPYEVSMVTSVAQAKYSFIHYFAATDQYIPVLIAGCLIGYLIKTKPNINLGSKLTHLFLWVGLMLLPFISTNWNEGFKPVEGNFSQFSFTCWFMLSKVMWCAGFGWLIFAVTTGRAGPLTDIFGLPFLRPISKLAFSIYINHITILSYRQLTKKEIGPLTHVEILTDDLADLVIAIGIAFFFYLVIERPLHHLINFTIKLDKEPGVPIETNCVFIDNSLIKSSASSSSTPARNGGARNVEKEEFVMKPLNRAENLA